MKHNVFDNDQQKKTEVLSHADQVSIILWPSPTASAVPYCYGHLCRAES